jgi:hypothetical protein
MYVLHVNYIYFDQILNVIYAYSSQMLQVRDTCSINVTGILVTFGDTY